MASAAQLAEWAVPGQLVRVTNRTRRNQPALQPRPPASFLVALVGVWRHFHTAFARLSEHLLHGEASRSNTGVALYTDGTTTCTGREDNVNHCPCVHGARDIRTSARELMGEWLVHVHLARATSFEARMADAWANGSLARLAYRRQALLVLRLDLALVQPLSVRDACAVDLPPPRRAVAHGGGGGGVAVRGSTVGFLACSPYAAAVMWSSDLDDDGSQPLKRDAISLPAVLLERRRDPKLNPACPSGSVSAGRES